MKAATVISIAFTLVMWGYFLGAFWLGFWVIFLFAGLLRGGRGIAWALCLYTRIFLTLLFKALPHARLSIPQRSELRRLRGSVVVCNHLSFLDPLLMMSLLPGAITIVRPDFFRFPVFGWLMRAAGFLGPDLFEQGSVWLGRVERHLSKGGNLFIFPEGTRSRDGRIAPFKKGAFFLAKQLAAPIVIIRLTGTGRLFAPGRFYFDALVRGDIEVNRLAVIPGAEAAASTTRELSLRVFGMFGSDSPRTARPRTCSTPNP
jgi:1-acyl-sn-glycerol-3-phosphate acyltransferase